MEVTEGVINGSTEGIVGRSQVGCPRSSPCIKERVNRDTDSVVFSITGERFGMFGTPGLGPTLVKKVRVPICIRQRESCERGRREGSRVSTGELSQYELKVRIDMVTRRVCIGETWDPTRDWDW